MLDFLKLLVPLFLAPKNYYQVRQKLGAFVVYEVWLLTALLRYISSVNLTFANVERAIVPTILVENAPWVMKVNLSGLILAFIVGLLFYMFHLHDRVSDILGIRVRFDKRKIILPLAGLVGVSLTSDQEGRIANSQDRVMRNVFYKYTSSRAENPLVDKHDIEQALESWSWLWVCLEGIVIWITGAIVALAVGGGAQAMISGGVALSLFVLTFAIRPFLARRARAQVEAIADNPTAHHEVSQYLNAI